MHHYSYSYFPLRGKSNISNNIIIGGAKEARGGQINHYMLHDHYMNVSQDYGYRENKASNTETSSSL